MRKSQTKSMHGLINFQESRMAGYSYAPEGVCSKQISFELENGRLHNVRFVGGCAGNLSAIAKLVEGANAQKTADLLRGHLCLGKQTSCADQLARAVDKALSQL